MALVAYQNYSCFVILGCQEHNQIFRWINRNRKNGRGWFAPPIPTLQPQPVADWKGIGHRCQYPILTAVGFPLRWRIA